MKVITAHKESFDKKASVVIAEEIVKSRMA